jgi:hypothetical protein
MDDPADVPSSLDPRQRKLLRARHELTRRFAALPIAHSADGDAFGFQTPVTSPLQAGSYVRIRTEGGVAYLGQVTDRRIAEREGPELTGEPEVDTGIDLGGMSLARASFRIRLHLAEGSGVLLGRMTQDGIVPTTDADLFEDAEIDRADARDVDRYLGSRAAGRATLDIGIVPAGNGAARARLLASGFDRHTFLCGQSGSGKTYSLGVILERLLLETDLPLVIIDPNSDFVHLGEPRAWDEAARGFGSELDPDTYAALSERYVARTNQLKVFRPVRRGIGAPDALRIRFSDLARVVQGLALQIDPLRDAEEYHALRATIGQLGRTRYSLADLQAAAQANLSEESRNLARRIANLGIAEWDIWAEGDEPSVAELLAHDVDWRAIVFDIGGFNSAAEKSLIATGLFGALWARRGNRAPVLTVIDEAHNICAQEPTDSMQAEATRRAMRIAAEGRKFGLYLLLSTQRPDKIHDQVLSQCDNLVLMRMNSASDLAQLASTFSFIPPSLMERASAFRQGESLIAGKIAPSPLLARFGGRISREGGSDVPATWAMPRTREA